MKILKNILVLLILSGCGISKNEVKLDLQKLENDSRTFRIENNWASPMADQTLNQLTTILQNGSSGSRINLTGNPNHFEIIGDSLSVDLPYFGVRQMGGGYNNDQGINIEEKFANLRISDAKQNSKILKMNARSKSGENFQFFVQIFQNGNTTIVANGSQRRSISYSGKITDWDN